MSRKRRSPLPDGERFVQLHRWLLQSPAYRSLGPAARALLVEFKARYSGTNNGAIVFSYREMEAALGVGNRIVMRAMDELIDRGFVREQQKGSFDWKARLDGRPSRATTWVLTEYPIDVPLRSLVSERTFMSWKPSPEKKTRYAIRTRKACNTHPIKDPMACNTHPNGVQDAPHNDENAGGDGVQYARTINIPHTPGNADGFHPLHISSSLKRVLAKSKKAAAS
jgi:hypothetical protein